MESDTMRRKGILRRNDIKFISEMKEIKADRFKRFPQEGIPSDRELTRLMITTDNWPNVKFELKNKPKRK